MHPMMTIALAEQRQAELRAAADLARLAAETRRTDRHQRPGRRRWWLRRARPRTAATQPSALAPPVDSTDLAHRLAEHGPMALDNHLRPLLDRARRHGVSPLLVELAADSGQPDVARLRAIGKILVELAGDQVGRTEVADTSASADGAVPPPVAA